ncbi:MAG: hypothetical protein Q9206_004758 [Seirophora lacunosa]
MHERLHELAQSERSDGRSAQQSKTESESAQDDDSGGKPFPKEARKGTDEKGIDELIRSRSRRQPSIVAVRAAFHVGELGKLRSRRSDLSEEK